ncbi:uncharacterized protein G2W53_038152 [Senna tora]|uniref:Secreted protein n=1 Tax=Senna tora TaxID=362788 RepID=A0A834SMH9_9FABA|nr:uncharacterized protein G2W53_038152 [Senna tora]
MWWWWFTARSIFFLSLHSSTCHRVKIRLMYSDSHPLASFHTLINNQMPKSSDSNKPSLISFTDLTRLHSKEMVVAAVNHHHHHILSFFPLFSCCFHTHTILPQLPFGLSHLLYGVGFMPKPDEERIRDRRQRVSKKFN